FGEGSDKRTDEDVWEALRIAQSEEFVKAKGGLDADTEQLGKNLSGGQKQRLSIARAICRDPEFYILDDTFSALDMKTDRDLREALKKKAEHSTKIIVAQRISTIVDADLILVLDEGKVAGLGKHYDLLETCPVYREIASSQMAEGTI
ncbi:MAG: ABC transporter ATP-binding protein/permease, partial [archaeon]|nr:ABC transporter ATP-binding protein/permease [archaeon]